MTTDDDNTAVHIDWDSTAKTLRRRIQSDLLPKLRQGEIKLADYVIKVMRMTDDKVRRLQDEHRKLLQKECEK